jgi:hypothetical protein
VGVSRKAASVAAAAATAVGALTLAAAPATAAEVQSPPRWEHGTPAAGSQGFVMIDRNSAVVRGSAWNYTPAVVTVTFEVFHGDQSRWTRRLVVRGEQRLDSSLGPGVTKLVVTTCASRCESTTFPGLGLPHPG